MVSLNYTYREEVNFVIGQHPWSGHSVDLAAKGFFPFGVCPQQLPPAEPELNSWRNLQNSGFLFFFFVSFIKN